MKLVVTEFLSLDGIMQDPGWTFPYWNDDIANFKGEETSSGDALLLGRVTYQGFAAAWPQSKDQGAAYFNSVPKYVVSTTLDKVEWNNSRLIKDNIVAEIAQLKQQEGTSLVVHGSGKLVQTLIQNKLVDEFHLLVYPVVIGKGQRLFPEGTETTLKLVSAKPLGQAVAMIYQPA